MLNANRAERILSRVTTPERAVAIVGDLAEQACKRGTLWFWRHVFRTVLSHMRLSEEQRLGLMFGLISGGLWMRLLTMVPMTIVFHDAMMLDPSNIHEFARGAGRAPSQEELSQFLYWDALAGGLNMLWVGPLLGLTLGTLGAFFGKAMFRSDQKRAVAH